MFFFFSVPSVLNFKSKLMSTAPTHWEWGSLKIFLLIRLRVVFYGCFHPLWKLKYHHGFKTACEYVLFFGSSKFEIGNFTLHPGRLTWNIQITHLERKMIFQTPMIMFHVNLPGCMMCVGCWCVCWVFRKFCFQKNCQQLKDLIGF